jgi:ketosteroid isomerase-like protein
MLPSRVINKKGERHMSDAYSVGKQLVELCKQGKNFEAIDRLYAPDVVSVEVHGMPELPARMEGIEAVRRKNRWWFENHTMHEGGDVVGPFPHGDRFIVLFKHDVTAKVGPMAGQRMQMEEAGLYTVKDGKIVQEEFFYHMGG